MTPLHRQVADLFYPLTDFYSSHGMRPPRIDRIDGSSMPQPYRDLLVHDRDMTTTLEAHWGEPLRVRVIEKLAENERFTRQVVLETAASGRAVEFGAIRIHLDQFDADARAEILACVTPLGTILNRRCIAFACRPNAYFSFACDEIARRAFGLHRAHTLYGRHNLLEDGGGALLAEVVEILPPLGADGESA